MTASNVFSATSFSMLNGGRMVKITLWPVCFSNSPAMAFAAIYVDPTLSTRTSAAGARVDETISVSVLTVIAQKDRCMMSSRNAAVLIARRLNAGALRMPVSPVGLSPLIFGAAGGCRLRLRDRRRRCRFLRGRLDLGFGELAPQVC